MKMEASVDPQCRGPDWMPITPKTGSLFHAETHIEATTPSRDSQQQDMLQRTNFLLAAVVEATKARI
jgi:hypothetical protein